MDAYLERVSRRGMITGSIKLSCDISNNLFKDVEDKLGFNCSVMDDESRIGDFNIALKNVKGNNKIDFSFSKDFLGNIISKNLKLDGFLENLGNFM
jgi:hypothetical protein